MTLTRVGGLALVMAALSLTAGGCCDKEKKQIKALQGQYNDLSSQNTDLRDQLSGARQRQSELLAQIDTKDGEISSLRTELAATPAAPEKGAAAPGWQQTTIGDKITVGSDILFSSGRATLTTAGTQALAKVAADIRRSYPGLPVRVYGYTDSDPIKKTRHLWKDNLDLSANRAMAVTRYLISKGIKAEAVETIAMGSTHYVTSNTTKAGKTKNRRVEIFVIK